MKLIRYLSLTVILCLISTFANAQSLQIEIDGLPAKLRQTVLNNLSLVRYQSYALGSDSRLNLLYSESAAEIQQALQPYGYYQTKVSSTLNYEHSNQRWLVHYQIDLGPQLKIDELAVKITGPGANDPNLQAALKQLPLQLGQPLLQQNYDDAKTLLETTALAYGYFEAKLTRHVITVDLPHYTSNIELSLATGPQFHIGAIHFQQQQQPYSDAFLQRFLTFKTGQVYQSSLITTLQNNLNSTGYFSSVLITPTPNLQDQTVDITIALQSRKSQQYTAGIGYGSDTKTRGLLGWELRHITDTGQRFVAQIAASALYSRFTANYIIPGKNPVTDSTSLNASQAYITVIPYTAHETAFGADYTQKLSSQWQRTFGLHQYFVDYTTPGQSAQSAYYLLPSVQGYYQNSNDSGYWQRGYNLTLSLTGSATGAFSEFSFLQGTANYNYSLPLMDSNRLLFSIDTGDTVVNNITNLPPTLRFYAGGIDSVRGYSYQSLGPNDNNGNLIGGQYLLTANINFEQHLLGNWSGIVFYDLGNAFNDFNSINPQHGRGVGVSWQSPLGPVRFYVSQGLDLPGEPWRVDFSIGAQL